MHQTKTPLENISAKSWEHPADRAALSALEKVPGLDFLIKKMVGATTEKSIRLANLASSVRTSERQFAKVHHLHREACRILDIESVPELYVSQNPFLNAGAIGVEDPFIVLNSSMVETLSDDEILAVIGHELGHCMSGHMLYKTLLQVLLSLSSGLLRVPIGGVAIVPILLALKEWDRKSELSADRAGLLVTQDPMTNYSLLMKLAGGASHAQMDINEFFLQAAEYKDLDGFSDNVHKLLNVMTMTHPFPVLRLTELKTWVDAGEYERILSGEYVSLGEREDPIENMKSAAHQYREDIEAAKGPLAQLAAGLFDGADSLGRRAGDLSGDLKDRAGDLTDDLKGKAGDVWSAIFDEEKA